jgi:hypothetical protein
MGAKSMMTMSYYFNKEGFVDVYQRNYKRIQSVLAEIGGFISFLRIFVAIMLYFYNQVILVHLIYKGFAFHHSTDFNHHSSLIMSINNPTQKNTKVNNFLNNNNSVFNLETHNNNGDQNNKKKVKFANAQDPADLEKIDHIDLTEYNPKTVNSNSKQNSPFTKNLDSKIKVNPLPSKWYVCKNLLFLKTATANKEKNLYVMARVKLINTYLNVTSLIKITNEVNLLKNILIKEKSLDNFFADSVKVIPLHSDENKKDVIPLSHLNIPENDEEKTILAERYLHCQN